MRVHTLLLVVTEYHASLCFALRGRDVGNGLLNLLIGLLMNPELFNAIAVYLEFLMAEFVLGVVFVSRDNRVKVKYTFVGSLEIHHIVCVCIEAVSLLF